MSKRNLMLVAFGLILGFQMQAQTLEMMKKAMAGRGGGPAFSFFKDEALSMPMEAVMDGDTRFFVKVKMDKSKVQRLGSYAGRPSASLIMKVGSFNLYRGKKEFGKSLMDIAKNEGFVVYEVDLNSEDGDLQAFLNSAYAEETKLPIDLSVEVVKYKRVAEGSFVMDLSRGKSKYLSAGVQSQGNYAFNYTDEFSDAKHKTLAIDYLNQRANVQIGKFAWWHKEPASVENRVSYQKYLAKVTYKSTSDSQCREATVEYWKSKSPNEADYALESATLQTGNAKLIPCGRAMN